MPELWHRYVKSDWPEYQKGPASVISDVTSIPRPPGSPSSNWIKFHYVNGDLWNGTARCEGSNTGSRNTTPAFHKGDEVWLRYWFVWEQIATYSSNWNIFFQSHFGSAIPTAQPNLTISAAAGRKLQFRHSAGGGHTIDYQSAQDVSLNTIHKILLGVKISDSLATGWIEWWYDDVNVVPRKSAVTWPSNGDLNYWKQGIYRSGSISGDDIFYNNGFQVFDSDPGSSPPPPPPPIAEAFTGPWSSISDFTIGIPTIDYPWSDISSFTVGVPVPETPGEVVPPPPPSPAPTDVIIPQMFGPNTYELMKPATWQDQ